MNILQIQLIGAMLLAALCSAVGNALLSVGMKQVGKGEYTGVSFAWAAFTNGYAMSGTLILGIFFSLFAYALSKAELSYVLPVTTLSYVFAAFIAKIILHEPVSPMRWLGTAVIMIGVAIIIKSS